MSKKNADEIEISVLFDTIINVIKRLARAIARFFSWIGKGIVNLLLFLRKYALFLAIATILGGIYGYYQSISFTNYKMVIQPEESLRPLVYNQIEYFNNSKTLEGVKTITIQPVINKDEQLNLYMEKALELDTLFTKQVVLKDYINDLNESDYQTHEIIISSAENINNLKEIQQKIISSLQTNPTFKKIQNERHKSFLEYKNSIQKSVNTLDSILLSRAQTMKHLRKEGDASTVVLAQANIESNDLDLINKKQQLIKKLHDIDTKLMQESNIVTVLSDFRISSPSLINNKLLYAIYGFLIMVLILLVYELNKYLGKVKR